MAKVVQAPYTRGLKLGMRGYDVFALNRALMKGGYLRSVKTPGSLFDEHTRRGVVRLQTAKKFPTITGMVGPKTFKALLPMYDGYGVLLNKKAWAALHKQTTRTSRAQKQNQTIKNTRWRRDRANRIHYTQSSMRMQGVRERMRPVPPKLSIWEDCSSEATYEHWLVGWPDPNGLGYNGQGYTGTQIRHGWLVSNPEIGDLVFYGPGRWDISHVAVYVGHGMVYSHGSEAGPFILPINYRPVRQIRRYSK